MDNEQIVNSLNYLADQKYLRVAGRSVCKHAAERIDTVAAKLANPLDDPRVKALVEAAKAVVDRWDSPQWKDLRHTGTHINELRDALSAMEKNK